MKRAKKFLSVLLALCLLLSCGTLAFAEDTPTVVASGDCGADGDNLQWELYSDGTLYINGDGAMADYDQTDAPWMAALNEYEDQNLLNALGYESYADLDAAMQNGTLDGEAYYEVIMQYGYEMLTKWSNLQKKVVIGEGVTGIGERAFAGWEATELSLPSTLKTIGKGAFAHGKYTEIALPEGLLEIGDEAFSSVPLREITIPASVQTIGDSAFSACDDLEKITVLNDRFDVSALMLYAYESEKEIPFASHADYKAFTRLSYQFDYLALLRSAAYFVSDMRAQFPWWTAAQRTAFEEMQLIAGIRVELGYDTTSADECAAALAADINATLGTDFTVDEILGTPIPTYRCSDALLDAVNAYDDATGDPYVSEIGHFADTYFAQAVTHLNCRDTFLANEMVKGLTADEAAARYDERAAELLGILNEKLDPAAADLASAVPQALAMINATLGTDYTLETAGAFIDCYDAPSAALVDAIIARFNPAVRYPELESFGLYSYPADTDGYTVVPWLTLSGGCTAAVKDFAETAGIPYEPIHRWGNWHIDEAEINQPARRIRTCSVCQQTEAEDLSFDDCNWTPLPTSPDGLENGAYYLDFTTFASMAGGTPQEMEAFLNMYNNGEYFFDEEKLVFKETLTVPAEFSESGEDETITLTDFIENDGFELMGYCLREAGAQWYPVAKTTEGLQDGDWYIDISAADDAIRERLEGCDIYVNPNGKLEKYLVVPADMRELEYTGEFYPLMTKWMEMVGPYTDRDDYTPNPYYAWPDVCPVQQYSDPNTWLPIATSTEGLADGDWYLDKEAYLDAYADGYTAYYVNEVNSDDYPGNDITPAEAAVMRDQLRADAAAQEDFFPVNPFIKPGGQPFEFKFNEVYVDPDTGDTVSYTLYLPRTDDAAGILYYQMFKAGVKQYSDPVPQEVENWIALPYTTDGLSEGDWYLDTTAFMNLIGEGKTAEEKAAVLETIKQHVTFFYNPDGIQLVYKYIYTDLPDENGNNSSDTVILPYDLTTGSADAFPFDYSALQQSVKQYTAPTTPDDPGNNTPDEPQSGLQRFVAQLRSFIQSILSFFRRLFKII